MHPLHHRSCSSPGKYVLAAQHHQAQLTPEPAQLMARGQRIVAALQPSPPRPLSLPATAETAEPQNSQQASQLASPPACTLSHSSLPHNRLPALALVLSMQPPTKLLCTGLSHILQHILPASQRPTGSPGHQGTRLPLYTQPAAQAAPATEQHMQAGAAASPGPDSLQPCSLRHHGSPHTAAGLLRPGSSSAHGPSCLAKCNPGPPRGETQATWHAGGMY
jgi:hypothetical protein